MPETKKYYHNLDVDNNKIVNLLLNPLTTAQRTAVGTLLGPLDEGYVCFDTTLNQQFFWDGTTWIAVTGGGGTWGSITGVITAQTDLIAYLAANYYPLSSNPANYIDLTDLSGGTGISYNNLTGVITNSAPDQTVVLNNGTGISVTGTYPNFTITNSSPSSGGTVTSVGTSAPLTGGTITTTGTIGITQSSALADGYLSSTDWTTFNSKEPAIASGTTSQYWRGDKTWQTFPTIPTVTPSALTKVDDTNVTLTLGGTPSTALLQSVSLTLGWTGTLADSRIASATNWNAKQDAITLTTTGTSGAATFIANTLNIPQYQAAGTYVTSVGATGPITSSGGTTPTISTSMNTNKLIGRSTAGTGVMEEITVGTGLSLSAGTLSSTVTGGLPKGTTSGTDTYTTTISGVSSYNDGDAYLIRFTNGNTTGCTLNINGLGAVTLYRNNDGVLIGGDIISGSEMICVYNSTLTGFQCIGTAPNTLLGYVTNDDSVTITKGQVVYAFGGQGDRMTVKLASNTADATSARTVGVVLSTSIAANQKGLIMMQGLLDGLSILPTATYSDGDPVYLGATAGSITNVKPYAPNHLVYVATVTTASNGSSGRMYVNIQNGYELDELHNVQAQSPTYKDTLWYDNTVSPAQWKTASISTILGYTPVGGSGTTNELAYFTGSTTLGSLTTATYPSLTELSYVKGVTSAIQTQLGTKANLSQAAYTMLANNTNATANMAAQTFNAQGSQTYSGTITWTGTTQPSGATNHTINWTQVGNLVTLRISLVYAAAGSALTAVQMALPTGAGAPPTPLVPAGYSAASALDVLYYGSGQISTTTNTAPAVLFRAYLRVNAATTGYELIITTTTAQNARVANMTVQYFTS